MYERKFDNLKNCVGIKLILFVFESINKKLGCGLYFIFFFKEES